MKFEDGSPRVVPEICTMHNPRGIPLVGRTSGFLCMNFWVPPCQNGVIFFNNEHMSTNDRQKSGSS